MEGIHMCTDGKPWRDDLEPVPEVEFENKQWYRNCDTVSRGFVDGDLGEAKLMVPNAKSWKPWIWSHVCFLGKYTPSANKPNKRRRRTAAHADTRKREHDSSDDDDDTAG